MHTKKTQTRIMGILNVTPDSFSDGGRYSSEERLQAGIEKLLHDGADIVDVGGESTRPGSEAVSEEEELRRVLPAIVAIRKTSSIAISVDTTKAEVARQALAAGADIINDISGLEADTDMAAAVRKASAQVVIMHMQGRPRTMQEAPHYDDVVAEVNAYLAARIASLEALGIERKDMIVDPGLGFGKTVEHNLSLLRNLSSLRRHGCPVLIGHSRKSFLGAIVQVREPEERDTATALLSGFCARQGMDILRVHNVAATRQALQLCAALQQPGDAWRPEYR
ncbi:MAG: dihydropteroate synthase [bacterium]|nr:dihydropteroate synthase [bacterium]